LHGRHNAAAEAGRTEVRMEALRAALLFGTAEAVPLSFPQAEVPGALPFGTTNVVPLMLAQAENP